MKKRFFKPSSILIILIACYLLSAFISTLAISAIPTHFFQQKNFHVGVAKTIVREYLADKYNTLIEHAGRNTGIYIYDAAGNRIVYAATAGLAKETVFNRIQQDLLPSVLTGEELNKFISFEPFSLYHSIGIPIQNNGNIEGAVFFIKKQTDLFGSILVFLIIYTILYGICAFFIFKYVQKRQKLDLVQQSYIANVTHALKAPIASVKALTEALCDVENIDVTQQRTYYGLILQEMNQQSHTVHEILELSKLQSRERDFSKVFVDAAECFEPVLNKYSMLCECANADFLISPEIPALPMLYTNASCIEQLLEILLENALKYSKEECKIAITASVTKTQITICVRDNGIGIAKKDLPYVFERFFRCNHGKSGNGLGLAIARELASGLKEKIWVESELGKGTAFFFTVARR